MREVIALRKTTEKPVRRLIVDEETEKMVEAKQYLFTDTGLITKWDVAVRITVIGELKTDRIELEVRLLEPKNKMAIQVR